MDEGNNSNNNQNIHSLKKLQILFAIDVLTSIHSPSTTDNIEALTGIPRHAVARLLHRYRNKSKTVFRRENEYLGRYATGYFVYYLTRKGRNNLNDLINRFNDNVRLRKCHWSYFEDHDNIVLLPGLSDLPEEDIQFIADALEKSRKAKNKSVSQEESDDVCEEERS